MQTGSQVRVVPAELSELQLLRGFADGDALGALAERFEQRDYTPGQLIVQAGQPADSVFLVAHGKVEQLGEGPYGDEAVVGLLADGDTFGRPGARRAGRRLAVHGPRGDGHHGADAAYQAVADRHTELRAMSGHAPGTSPVRPTRSARRRSRSAPDMRASRTCRARSWTPTSPRASTNSASPRPC